MYGIDMNQPIEYEKASFRFFEKNEYHIARLCKTDVLLLVFEGVLRFSEDGTLYEVHPGEYHIQKANTQQWAPMPSDAPKYLFVHFTAHWTDASTALSKRGQFDYAKIKSLMETLDQNSHAGRPYIQQVALFYTLLTELMPKDAPITQAQEIAAYIQNTFLQDLTLEEIAEQFHFSKNHVINVFKREFSMPPFAYRNQLRLNRAEYLLEVTSTAIEDIALQCGFHHYSHFYRMFLRKNNISPAQWRILKQNHLSVTK